MDYRVIAAATNYELQSEVQLALAAGWQLAGGVAVAFGIQKSHAHWCFAQALARPDAGQLAQRLSEAVGEAVEDFVRNERHAVPAAAAKPATPKPEPSAGLNPER
jgi:hypothetical protein